MTRCVAAESARFGCLERRWGVPLIDGGTYRLPRIVGAAAWDILRANIRLLKKAGIPIGIGTDAGIGGVYHGASAIREITILTRLGFSASEALVAATRTSAAIMGQAEDHGTIEVGKLADLTIVEGDLYAMPATELYKAQVRYTVVDGEIVTPASSRP